MLDIETQAHIFRIRPRVDNWGQALISTDCTYAIVDAVFRGGQFLLCCTEGNIDAFVLQGCGLIFIGLPRR